MYLVQVLETLNIGEKRGYMLFEWQKIHQQFPTERLGIEMGQ